MASALPASSQVPTPQPHNFVLPGVMGVSGAITCCTRSTAGGTTEGTLRALEGCERGFRSGGRSVGGMPGQPQPDQVLPHPHTDPWVLGAWH